MSADIEIITSLPAAHELGQRLADGALEVMREFAVEYREDWRNRWVGWEYKERKAGDPVLVSQQEWIAKALPTDRGAVLEVRNEARGYRNGKPYVAAVHRAGTPKSDVEWRNVREAQVNEIDARFFAALSEASTKPGPPSRRRIRADGPDTRVSGTTLTF
jgi:hypothetical protein